MAPAMHNKIAARKQLFANGHYRYITVRLPACVLIIRETSRFREDGQRAPVAACEMRRIGNLREDGGKNRFR
jgi:hypothetical protein